MKERAVHNADGPRLERVIHRHDLEVGIVIEVLIDMLCKVSTEQVVVAIFCVQSDFSVVDIAEGHVQVVLNCWQQLLG